MPLQTNPIANTANEALAHTHTLRVELDRTRKLLLWTTWAVCFNALVTLLVMVVVYLKVH